MKNLEDRIREYLPRLKRIEVGQKFLSKYYGIITATKVDNLGGSKFDIYGFDEMEGLPRSNYYPRDLELVGHPIKLNDVLEYVKLKVSKVSHHKVLGNVCLDWDLFSVFLADQSDELKEFLNNL